jgi:hypothetical protein
MSGILWTKDPKPQKNESKKMVHHWNDSRCRLSAG